MDNFEVDRSNTNKIVATHFTDYGLVNFYSLPHPHFVFVNPKAKKKEIKCYMPDIKLIANALTTAQSVSKNYIAQRDGEESKGHNKTLEEFETWLTIFKENLSKEEGMNMEHTIINKDNIYCKEFGEPYGNDKIKIKLVLMVNLYERKPHIWLKPLWRDDKTLDKSWHPTLRGFQFTLKDDGRDLVCWAINQQTTYYDKLKNAQN